MTMIFYVTAAAPFIVGACAFAMTDKHVSLSSVAQMQGLSWRHYMRTMLDDFVKTGKTHSVPFTSV